MGEPPIPPNTVAIFNAPITDGYTTSSILSSNIAYCFGDSTSPGVLVLQESPDDTIWTDAQSHSIEGGVFDLSAVTSQRVRVRYQGGDNVITLFLNSA